MCVCGTVPCARIENRVSLVLNAYGNGCLRAVTGIKRIENRVSLVLKAYGNGGLRAVTGIKIRDVRGLGVTQFGVGGGKGLGYGRGGG
jgi:hypothetical protein